MTPITLKSESSSFVGNQHCYSFPPSQGEISPLLFSPQVLTPILSDIKVSASYLTFNVIEIKLNLQRRSTVLIPECSVSTIHLPALSVSQRCIFTLHWVPPSPDFPRLHTWIFTCCLCISIYFCFLSHPIGVCKHIFQWLYLLLIIHILLEDTADLWKCPMCKGQMGYFWLWKPKLSKGLRLTLISFCLTYLESLLLSCQDLNSPFKVMTLMTCLHSLDLQEGSIWTGIYKL